VHRIGIYFPVWQITMTNPRTRLVIDDVLMDPSRYFAHPAEVLEDDRLNREQKRRILRSWALDAQLIDEAESENMRGRPGERSQLREARLALLKLDG
jgi:hypothetical protein